MKDIRILTKIAQYVGQTSGKLLQDVMRFKYFVEPMKDSLCSSFLKRCSHHGGLDKHS